MRYAVYLSAIFLVCCMGFAQAPASTSDQAAASAPAQNAVTTTESPEVQEFQKIESSWANAVNQHDQYAMELVLSPLFVDVSASGDIATRNQLLALMISGEDKTVHLDQKVIAVRMLGDIAVANGTYVLQRKAGSAHPEEKGVFTHVFERLRGGWVCINSQRTELPKDTNTKSKKQSSADMPFFHEIRHFSNRRNCLRLYMPISTLEAFTIALTWSPTFNFSALTLSLVIEATTSVLPGSRTTTSLFTAPSCTLATSPASTLRALNMTPSIPFPMMTSEALTIA
jgi:ketosteroid isomerase-like protein